MTVTRAGGVQASAAGAPARTVATARLVSTRSPAWRRFAPGLVLFAALTGVTEAVVRGTHVAAFIFPPPSAVLAELFSQPGLYARSALVTVDEAGAGLALGAVTAFLFAAAAVHSRLLDRVLTPLVVVSQTIPVIAVAPLLVLWLGYGVLPRVIICALIAFFPMAVNTLEGFRATDPQLLLLLRSVDAGRWDVFWRVRVPGAAPFLMAGLRAGVTLSLVGAVVAEWTGGTERGLGYLVLSANARLATAQAFAAVLVITALGLAAFGVVGLLERRVCWWSGPARVDRLWRRKGRT
jgi:ABC-type nitrate/sulfonate/bicarbonate transport system permease component